MKRDIDLSDEYVVHGSAGMTRGSVLRIEDGRDMVIYVWEGGVWLTEEGDRRDRYLGPGDCFRLERDGVHTKRKEKRSRNSGCSVQSRSSARTRSGIPFV